MDMKESTEKEILALLDEKPPFMILFFSTPFCGKCVIAERNLEAVLAQIPPVPVYKCIVDYAPQVVERLQVTSAPSIKFLVNGEVVHTSFGIRTTDDLYYNISPYVKRDVNPYEDFDWGDEEEKNG